jgi:hypothetical protein
MSDRPQKITFAEMRDRQKQEMAPLPTPFPVH